MNKKEKKEVAYEDTFDFKVFPEYEYTQAQKSRFRLFQGRVEHWRKAINYADAFNNPSKINLLCMIAHENVF